MSEERIRSTKRSLGKMSISPHGRPFPAKVSGKMDKGRRNKRKSPLSPTDHLEFISGIIARVVALDDFALKRGKIAY